MAAISEGHLHHRNDDIHDDDDFSSAHHMSHAPHPNPHLNRRMPALPDLRFEYSYLRSVRAFVQIERTEDSRNIDKGKAVARSDGVESESRREVVHVQWGKIVWITVRDQVLSPLLQGALWGVASHFILPVRNVLAATIQSWWGSTSYHPSHEGGGITRLRSWVGGLYSGTVRTSLSR